MGRAARGIFLSIMLMASFQSHGQRAGMLGTIDEIFLDLFQTRRMKPLLAQLMKCNPSAIQMALGVSPQVANILGSQNYCQGIHRGGTGPVFSRAVTNIRSYDFERVTSPRFSIDSFTSLDNKTTIFLNSPLDKTLMAEILVHELAIFFDSRQIIRFGRFIPDWYDRSDPQAVRAFEILDNPSARLALAAARAFQVEEEALSELAQKFPDKYQFRSGDFALARRARQSLEGCKAFVYKFFSENLKDIKPLANNNVSGLFSETVGVTDTLETLMSSGGVFDGLSTVTIKSSRSQARISLCQEYAHEALSSENMAFSVGPRPRTTGKGSSGD